MAKHDVSFESPRRPLGKADLVFHVTKNDEKLGRLAVSQGGIEWKPKDSTYGYHMNWTELSALIAKNGTKKN